MARVLIITNDFPPRVGGIQSFVHAAAMQLSNHAVVYAPAWQGAPTFDHYLPLPVVRHPTSLMLPSGAVRRRALAIMASEGCDRVLFGAAAPLGLLAPALRRAGAQRIVAITHGHETGWAALPVARQLLSRIGDSVDIVTYLGEYGRDRLARALSPAATARMKRLAPGVDLKTFRPDIRGNAVRERLRLGTKPVVLCVSRLVPRKGQDTLIRAMPMVLHANENRPVLLLVGRGPYLQKLHSIAQEVGVAERVVFAGEVANDDLPAYYNAADVFAMPCRTRWAGLDVEGLGIVFLEAAASGLPVIAGSSGGAPDAVLDGETGFVVPGGEPEVVANRLNQLLADPALARDMGAKGRAWMQSAWQWSAVGQELRKMLEL
ncbi:MAG: glycosyltransferase family 4 protein [Bradyrhizobium sp.]|nr:glycosyltransferase family 4 protein [Bradyrhizobium sp.]